MNFAFSAKQLQNRASLKKCPDETLLIHYKEVQNCFMMSQEQSFYSDQGTQGRIFELDDFFEN